MSNVFEIKSFRGLISDWEDKGTPGAFKFGYNLNIRKVIDSLSCNQALIDEGLTIDSASPSRSPSASQSPSASSSPSPSLSKSPSSSVSPSPKSPSASISPSASHSPSASASPSASTSPSSSISPSPSSSGLSVFHGLIKWFVNCSDGNTYGFDDIGRIYKRNPDAYWIQVYNAGQKITGAYEWPAHSGKTYLYFATRTNLHRKEIPGSSQWNDVDQGNWPKTDLNEADSHMMREAGGSLIICNGAYLALVGYDESYTNEALNLIPGNVAYTIIERNGRSIIGTKPSNNLNKGTNSAIDTDMPLAQIGDDGELFYANMSDSIPLTRFPGGGIVYPGAVCNESIQSNFFEWEQTALSWIDKQSVGNMALWGVSNADSGKVGVYSYGRKRKNFPVGLNLEYLLDVDEIGAITNANGTLLISYRDGSNFGVKAVDATSKAIAMYEALDLKAPTKQPGDITQWKLAELFMAPLPSGASIEFWYRFNKTGSWLQAKTVNGDTTYSVTNGQKAVFSIGGEGEIFEHKIYLNPSGNNSPEIYRDRIYFS